MTDRRVLIMIWRDVFRIGLLCCLAFHVAPVVAQAQQPSPTARAEYDLNRFAAVVAGQEMDRRCRILTRSQRDDYAQHVKVIRLGFQTMGLSMARLNDLEAAARDSAERGPARRCDQEVADTVRQIGIMTAELGSQMANWLAANKGPTTGK